MPLCLLRIFLESQTETDEANTKVTKSNSEVTKKAKWRRIHSQIFVPVTFAVAFVTFVFALPRVLIPDESDPRCPNATCRTELPDRHSPVRRESQLRLLNCVPASPSRALRLCHQDQA